MADALLRISTIVRARRLFLLPPLPFLRPLPLPRRSLASPPLRPLLLPLPLLFLLPLLFSVPDPLKNKFGEQKGGGKTHLSFSSKSNMVVIYGIPCTMGSDLNAHIIYQQFVDSNLIHKNMPIEKVQAV